MSGPSERRAAGGRASGTMLVLGVALLLVSACKRAPPISSVPPETLVGPEDVVTVERELLSTGPRISGALEPRERARVLAEIGGTVSVVNAELGDQVAVGQELARIDAQQALAAVRAAAAARTSAQAELELAEQEYARAAQLVEAGALAKREGDRARSGLAVAKARLAQASAELSAAREQRSNALVRSPIAGVVSERSIAQGDVVVPGAPLFTIIDPSTMRLSAHVPAESLSAHAPDARVDFQVRGYGDRPFSGTIERISPAVDATTRQLTILIDLPNPSRELVAGLFAEGRVLAKAHEALVVPLAAVEQDGGLAHVLRVRDGEIERIPIELGLVDEATERVELIGDVAPGDELLTGAARTLEPGTEVRITARPAPPTTG